MKVSVTFRIIKYCFSVAIKLTSDILTPSWKKLLLLVGSTYQQRKPSTIHWRGKRSRFLPHNLERLGSLQKYKKYAQAQI